MKYKKYVDESYVIWSSAQDEEINVHFNEWYSPPECFLDIGVRVCKAVKTDDLFIYLPLKLEKSGIEDLFSRFDEEWINDKLEKLKTTSKQIVLEEPKTIVKNIACAIFNSNCEITKGIDIPEFKNKASQELLRNIIRIKHGARIDYVVNLKSATLNSKANEDKNSNEKGILLHIDCREFKKLIKIDKEIDGYEKGLYVRFRVPHPPLEKKHLKKGISSGTFLDAPNSNTLIQYMQRVNELRSLPLTIRENYKGIEKQYIGKVMSMLAANKKYEIDDSDCYKIRQLEYNLHKMYMPEGFVKNEKKDAINIYQWNAVNKKPIGERTNSFIFNIKIKRDRSTAKDWLRYILVGLVSTVISILFSWIFSRFLP